MVHLISPDCTLTQPVDFGGAIYLHTVKAGTPVGWIITRGQNLGNLWRVIASINLRFCASDTWTKEASDNPEELALNFETTNLGPLQSRKLSIRAHYWRDFIQEFLHCQPRNQFH